MRVAFFEAMSTLPVFANSSFSQELLANKAAMAFARLTYSWRTIASGNLPDGLMNTKVGVFSSEE